MGRPLQRFANGLMFVLFVLAAAVQYNDPNPFLWMTVYGTGALCCALYLIDLLPVLVSSLVAGVCFVGALYLLGQILFGPGTFLDHTGQSVLGLGDEVREMIGLLITAVWTWILTWWSRRPTGASASPRST